MGIVMQKKKSKSFVKSTIIIFAPILALAIVVGGVYLVTSHRDRAEERRLNAAV